MKLVLTDKDGYEAVSDIIKEWAEKNQPYVYCAYIVDIWTPNGRYMQYVEYDISKDCWIWQNDWWEGENEIELFGFAPLDEIELPDKWQIENLMEDKMANRYLCDPRKNVECTKEGCRWRRGNKYGECFCTTKAEYAMDEVPDPICDHDYRMLEKDPWFSLVICFSNVSDDINTKCFGEKPRENPPVTYVKKKFNREDLED